MTFMVWDLRGALLKKEEVESARLADFDFRQRARTFRLLADKLDDDPATVVRLIAASDDPGVVKVLEQRHGRPLGDAYAECRREARRQLIAERGDPAPVRLL